MVSHPFDRIPGARVGQDLILVELTVREAAGVGRSLLWSADLLGRLPDFGQGLVVGQVGAAVQAGEWRSAADKVEAAIREHVEVVEKLRAAVKR